MKLSARRQQELRSFGWTMILVAIFGGFLGLVFAFAIGADQLLEGVAQGVSTGTFISICIGLFTIFYRNSPRGRWIKRLSFKQSLALNSVIYLLFITTGLRLNFFVFNDIGFLDFSWLAKETLIALLLSIFMALLINTGQQMDRMLGQGIIKKYLSGAYHKPREEVRVFLFIDVIGSTGMAEQIGAVKFHALLDRFFYDLTNPVLANKGEIHKYVGDEVIISWPVEAGRAKGNAFRCFFDVKREIENNRQLYEQNFGFVPTFRGAINAGPVVTGEIGDIKQEIVFLGDTVNTAARILAKASELKLELLCSETARELLKLPSVATAKSLGIQVLRGRKQQIELFEIESAL